jgi:transcription elongation regulator 1
LPQTSPSGAVPRTAQQQFYPSHPSAPGIIPPQPLWGYPTQPTSFQQAPFYSYPPGPLGRPMIGTSAVTTSLTNIQPPGITTGGDPKEPPSTNPGSVQPIHSSVEPHPTGILFTGVDDHLLSLSVLLILQFL